MMLLSVRCRPPGHFKHLSRTCRILNRTTSLDEALDDGNLHCVTASAILRMETSKFPLYAPVTFPLKSSSERSSACKTKFDMSICSWHQIHCEVCEATRGRWSSGYGQMDSHSMAQMRSLKSKHYTSSCLDCPVSMLMKVTHTIPNCLHAITQVWSAAPEHWVTVIGIHCL